MKLASFLRMELQSKSDRSQWPALPYDGWKGTYETLQRWVQIVGKIRFARVPVMNHSWSATLYVTARGLTTGPIPNGSRVFSLDFDFLEHTLTFLDSNGAKEVIPLQSESVADFYDRCRATLKKIDCETHFVEHPNELMDATPFASDSVHRVYNKEPVERFFQALTQADRVLKIFRSRFVGKCSPVHFFWGSFDLAVTRFSGRRAPVHPGGYPWLPDRITREAYSHEVSSCGFWPGNEMYPHPAFYSYAYPSPPGFESYRVSPPTARYELALHEFILPYDDVRSAHDPDETLLQFLNSTYEAAALQARWHRQTVEDSPYLSALQAERAKKTPPEIHAR